jgi:signal peptidase II
MTVAPATIVRNQSPWLPIAAAAILCVADRVCKAAALAKYELPGNVVSFSLFSNDGIAFSLPFRGWMFWLAAAPIFIGIWVATVVAYRRRENAVLAALIFVLLGAASNIYDRLAHGAVIDYFVFFRISAVNLADGMIVGGILAAVFLNHRKES